MKLTLPKKFNFSKFLIMFGLIGITVLVVYFFSLSRIYEDSNNLVLATSHWCDPPYLNFKGKVTDASTGKGIKAALTSEGKTVGSYDIATPYGKSMLQPGEYVLLIRPFDPNKSYQITATAYGQSQAKQIINFKCAYWPSLYCPSCIEYEATVNFSFSPIGVTPQPTPPQPPEQPPTVSPAPAEQPPTISPPPEQPPTPKLSVPTSLNKVKLPPLFIQGDSSTTDLSKIKDPKRVENLILEVVGKNKIVFKETLDLSAQKTITAFTKFDSYVRLDTLGKIELNSEALPALNKKATLTIFN